jgi:hypothetical protein
MVNKEDHGVWGGATQRERRRLRKFNAIFTGDQLESQPVAETPLFNFSVPLFNFKAVV